MFYKFKETFFVYFRGGAYFPDFLASLEKGAYFRGELTFEGALTFETLRYFFVKINLLVQMS